MTMTFLLVVVPVVANAQISKVKTVWVILRENHNWTGNNAGAAFGAPDIKGNPLAPYINGTLLHMSAHAEQYFNPPENHPSQPNYLWLEAGTNFGVLAHTQPGQPQLFTDMEEVEAAEAKMNAAQEALLNYVEGRESLDRDHHRRLVAKLKNAQTDFSKAIAELGE